MNTQMSRHVDTATVNYHFDSSSAVQHGLMMLQCQLLCHNKCAPSLLPRALYTTGWRVNSVLVCCHVHMSICSLGFNPSCGSGSEIVSPPVQRCLKRNISSPTVFTVLLLTFEKTTHTKSVNISLHLPKNKCRYTEAKRD